MSETPFPIVVIGAGAAGMIAAWRAASLGAPVVLLERNGKPGIKLLISGGGKCNITHAGEIEELRSAFRPREGRFLKPAFHRFDNAAIVTLLEEEGVPTLCRSDARIFPAGGRATDVVMALRRRMRSAGVELRCGIRALSVDAADGTVTEVKTGNGAVRSSHVILSTGGVSYPRTGTTGDGIAWAASLGHTIVPLRPALAPIAVVPPLPAAWRGVAIRGGALSVYSRGEKADEWRGDILFTHEGLSGPAALEVSRTAAVESEGGGAELRFDFVPDLDFSALDSQLADTVRDQRGRMIATVLEARLPNRLIPYLLGIAGVDPEKRGYVLTREERRAVTGILKSWTIGRVAGVPIDRGEVTAGGVSLEEVDPHTMRSRKVGGLYLCGEMLDIAGPVGGYNLQAAFSTGFVAGETAARDWLLQMT